MEILKVPHPHLFKPCREVTVFGPELKTLLDAMWETMVAAKGIGLASNQVGLDYRMFTMLGPDEEKMYIVNPKIISRSEMPANEREGCLSSPGEFLELSERAWWVHLLYQDEDGSVRSGKFNKIHAVCIQHEIDHLDGKSYLQSKSLSRARRRELAKKWRIK